MNNQCVPSWDLDEPAVVAGGGGGLNHHQVSTTAGDGGAHRGLQVSSAGAAGGAFAPVVVPMSDQYYEVAELTWEKGNISSHGLGLLNRPAGQHKYPPAAGPPSSQLHAMGGGGSSAGDRETLEAVVGEAAARSHFLLQPQPVQHPAAPWVGGAADAVARAAADALVPCTAARVDEAAVERGDAGGASRTRKRARVVGEDGGGLVCASQGSTAAAPGGRRGGESALLTLDYACGTGADDVCGFTTTTNNSTSLERDDKGSPDTENTSIGGGASDSRCFSRRSQAS